MVLRVTSAYSSVPDSSRFQIMTAQANAKLSAQSEAAVSE